MSRRRLWTSLSKSKVRNQLLRRFQNTSATTWICFLTGIWFEVKSAYNMNFHLAPSCSTEVWLQSQTSVAWFLLQGEKSSCIELNVIQRLILCEKIELVNCKKWCCTEIHGVCRLTVQGPFFNESAYSMSIFI